MCAAATCHVQCTPATHPQPQTHQLRHLQVPSRHAGAQADPGKITGVMYPVPTLPPPTQGLNKQAGTCALLCSHGSTYSHTPAARCSGSRPLCRCYIAPAGCDVRASQSLTCNPCRSVRLAFPLGMAASETSQPLGTAAASAVTRIHLLHIYAHATLGKQLMAAGAPTNTQLRPGAPRPAWQSPPSASPS